MHKRCRESRPIVTIATALIVVAAVEGPAAQAPSTQSGAAARDVPRTFEVASIKPSRTPAQLVQEAVRGPNGELMLPLPAGIRTFPGGRFTANVVTLRTLIARAYDVRDYQIEGGPPWAENEYFSIEARASGDATPAEFRDMLQSLLVARFNLAVHRSTRPGKLHTLVLARSDGRLGPGLTRTPAECVREIEERNAARAAAAAGSPSPPAATPSQARASSPPPTADRTKPGCGMVMMGGSAGRDTTLAVSATPISSLAERLAAEERAPVVDRSGLEGLFDYAVEFEAVRPLYPEAGFGGLSVNSTASPKPPLRIAIQDQLGLKLESVDGPVPILVIDAAERPTPD